MALALNVLKNTKIGGSKMSDKSEGVVLGKTYRCQDCESFDKELIYCVHGRSQTPKTIVQVGSTKYCFYFGKRKKEGGNGQAKNSYMP